MSGKLYVVATPIGNLEDATLRMIRILGEVTLIACEDTRVAAKLLRHFEIGTPTISYHDHNAAQRLGRLLEELHAGHDVALTVDAGTPGISDPGYRLISRAIEESIEVVAIPGASALTGALSVAGLPTDRFRFLGFLPPRQGARRRELVKLRDWPETIVLYESPHRLHACLADAAELMPDRACVVVRELTKLYETIERGSVAEVAARMAEAPVRGEVTVLLGPAEERAQEPDEEMVRAQLRELIEGQGVRRKEAVARVAASLGCAKNRVYALSLELGG